MKKIAIDIDFVLRDWLNALENIYIKQVGDLDVKITSLTDLWENFKFPSYVELQKETDDLEITENILAVDETSERRPNYEHFNQFINTNVLEIFGHAKEITPNAITHVNKLQSDNPELEITLFSKCKGKAIPATYFFLSKTGCEIKNIMFITSQSELLNYDKVILSNLEFNNLLIKNNIIFIKSAILMDDTVEKYVEDHKYQIYDSIKEVISFT